MYNIHFLMICTLGIVIINCDNVFMLNSENGSFPVSLLFTWLLTDTMAPLRHKNDEYFAEEEMACENQGKHGPCPEGRGEGSRRRGTTSGQSYFGRK